MIYLNQNLFTIDRQSVRENCNLFILFERKGRVLISIYQDFYNNVELSYNDFANICNKAWKEPYNYIVTDITDIYGETWAKPHSYNYSFGYI